MKGLETLEKPWELWETKPYKKWAIRQGKLKEWYLDIPDDLIKENKQMKCEKDTWWKNEELWRFGILGS